MYQSSLIDEITIHLKSFNKTRKATYVNTCMYVLFFVLFGVI